MKILNSIVLLLTLSTVGFVAAGGGHSALDKEFNSVVNAEHKEQLPKITEAEKQEALKFLEQNSMQEASIQQRVAKSLIAGLSLGAVCYIVYRFYYYATAASYPEQILTLQYLYKYNVSNVTSNIVITAIMSLIYRAKGDDTCAALRKALEERGLYIVFMNGIYAGYYLAENC